MKISQDTSSYNDRRYGKPWIALIDFSNGAKGKYTFGEWCGQPGDSGTLYIEANPGDVIAKGQKDSRKPSNSAPTFYIVETTGELTKTTKADAYKHWQQQVTQETPNLLTETSTDELLAELQRRGISISV